MDRSDLDRAMGDASQPSKPAARSQPISKRDLHERNRIYARMFTLCPLAATQDTEGAILAFIEETLDLSVEWLESGIRDCVREPDRRFAPSVGEIRGAAQRAKNAAKKPLQPAVLSAAERASLDAMRAAREASRRELLKAPPGAGGIHRTLKVVR